jgi:hypothetical protein
MRQRSIRAGLLVLAMVCALGTSALVAQEPGEQAVERGQFAGMQRIAGTVTAVSGDAVTLKAEDGTVYQVTTTANTRLMKGRGIPVKIADLKAGDGVTAAGNLDAPNKTLHAVFLVAVDAEQLKQLRANLGKTYIVGKVTAIDADNLKMTVQRQDGVSQTIGFDETTSFKRGGRGGRGGGMGMGASAAGNDASPNSTEGGESITLADIKVGDNVGGPGAMKAGVFVPTQLNIGRERKGRRARGAGAAGTAAGAATPSDGSAAPAKPQQ